MSAKDTIAQMLSNPDITQQRLNELRAARKKIQRPNTVANLRPGISVIMPSYKGANVIGRALKSVAEQTLDRSLFELLIVVNGPQDGAVEIIEEFCQLHPDIEIHCYVLPNPGLAEARNFGLQMASREYIVNLDDDDEFEPEYLEAAFEKARPDCIVINPIINVTEDGEPDADNILNQRIASMPDETLLTAASWLLSLNALKTVPSRIIKQFRYDNVLRSGEDLVFFNRLLGIDGLKAVKTDLTKKSHYRRWLRADSVSRQPVSFEFNVAQRLDSIKALQTIELNGRALAARRNTELAQAGFVKMYLDENPNDVDAVAEAVAERNVLSFPWKIINKDHARDLVFSYCFPPYADTSAVVAAKAVIERGNIVDVYSNKLNGTRAVDDTLLSLVNQYIDEIVTVDSPPSFSNWAAISEYAERAVWAANKRNSEKNPYETMYSRSMWVGSHLAAALFKLIHPTIPWTAEFSDPLRTDSVGKPRSGEFDASSHTAQKLLSAISARCPEDLNIQSLFDLVESATILLADEVIFTNKNQQEYVLKQYPKNVAAQIAEKSIVRHHPVPPKSAYNMVLSSYQLADSVVNIGYFGNFYVNRGLGDVLVALQNLPQATRDLVRLHVFCSDGKELRSLVQEAGLSNYVFVSDTVPYFEFLNLATKFDVLLVNDAQRAPGMEINPFLPSKYSDYKGSGTDIWGLVEEGSPLSTFALPFTSPVGNTPKAISTLQCIVGKKFSSS